MIEVTFNPELLKYYLDAELQEYRGFSGTDIEEDHIVVRFNKFLEFNIRVRIPVEELNDVQSTFSTFEDMINYYDDRKKTILIKVKNALIKYRFELDPDYYKDEEED